MGKALLCCAMAIVAICADATAQEYKPGDEVVVVEEGQLRSGTGSIRKVQPGMLLKVDAVKGELLWFDGETRWMNQRYVLPLDRAAIDRLTAMIRANPDDVTLYSVRGHVWRKLGDLDLALDDINVVIRLAPSWESYIVRGDVWHEKHEYDKAIADYGDVLQMIKPKTSSSIFARLGNAWRGKGEFDKAIANYNVALRLDPKSADAYNKRGLAWQDNHEYDKAIADHNEALRLDPKFAMAYNNRGKAWIAKDEYDKAIADFNEALRLDPKFVMALSNRGVAWTDKGEFDKAMADLNEALRLDPKDAETFGNRGAAWHCKAEYDNAVADYNEALRLAPTYVKARENRGVANWGKGDFGKAVPDFKESLARDPTKRYSPIFGHLAALQGGDDDAANEFLKAAGAYEEWPYPAIRFLRGEIDEPALLELAVDADKRTEARCYLGLIHEIAGRKDEALAHFHWVKEHGKKDFSEYSIALAELRRMEEAAK